MEPTDRSSGSRAMLMKQSHSGGRGSWTKPAGRASERSKGKGSRDNIGDGMMFYLTLFDLFVQ